MSQNMLLKLYVLVVCYWFRSSECIYGFVTWEGPKASISVSDYFADIPDNCIAKATYNNEINVSGWAYLEVVTSRTAVDNQQAFAAGYLEGFLTRELIWMHWQNMLRGYCYNKTRVCSLIEEFVDRNEKYVRQMVQENPGDPYWYQVNLYYVQLEGLAYGYNEATTDAFQWLSFRDIIWINMLGDLDELAISLSLPTIVMESVLFPDHCSGLVKLLPDGSDLYTAHVTWNSYQSMLRLQKMYILNYRTSRDAEKTIPGRKMSLSSYPAFVQSTDDFYILSSGLVAAETTIGNSNMTLFRRITPQCLFEFVRCMVANRLAHDGYEWVSIFRKQNSGTYNNQWYIVDYNKFTPKSPTTALELRPGLLWVIEQLPGYTHSDDLTPQLAANSYFPSYNIPYFPEVFNLSGGNVRVETFGPWFGYRTNPRAAIIKEKQATIHNMCDMYSVMRYNDFRHDPLARCAACDPPYSACNAIAARNDLNPANGTFPFRALGHRAHGATDAKLTSAGLRRAHRFAAVASPPHNIARGIPPFTWSKFDLGDQISHLGHPDMWMFEPVIHQWEWG